MRGDRAAEDDNVECEVCILGGGIAGLNALYACQRSLSDRDRVVLVDRRDAPAGMWNQVYSYVRLHQPHPMFTAGNIAWRGQTDPFHLANREEVVDHLRHCYELLRERSQLDPRFGHEYEGHDDSGEGRHPVTVHCRRVSDGARLTIRARRLIKAFGYNVEPKAPLPLSSQAVRSVSPDRFDLLGPEMQQSDAPVYIVGGGKTGMDTAHALIQRFPGKRIRMLIGAGTMFVDRDKTFPPGLGKHYRGHTVLEAFLDVAGRFDGYNELAVMDHFRRRYTVSLDPGCRRFMFGTLSPAENDFIRRGLDQVIRGHLEDVVDGPSGPTMVLRNGERHPVEPGAFFINATGYIRGGEYEPYLSETGNVLSIQPTSTTHFLSSQAAYFLTPLFLTDRLADVPLYETDLNELRKASRDAMPAAMIALTLHNTAILLERLPKRVLDENGLDFMRLLPLHRRLLAFAKLMVFLKLRPGHTARTLDVVQTRLGVRLGPLAHTPKPAAPAAVNQPVAATDG